MKFKQQPHALMMVRPASFGFNQQTAASNAFQQLPSETDDVHIQALEEFDRMVDVLRAHEVDVVVFDDLPEPVKPDAIFPNNWISFHDDGTVVLYPMMAENRRPEKRKGLIEQLMKDFEVKNVIDLSGEEDHEKYLEGTGSIVFDHINRVAYSCRSPRTNEALLLRLSGLLKYRPVLFSAVDENNLAIYHTNVMMSIGEKFAVVCLDAIRDEHDQEILLQNFAETGKKVVAISYAQMKAFAGNILEAETRTHEPVVLLSETAFQSLLPGQLNAITQFAEVLPLRVNTIEKRGGGSVRCMVADICLPKRKAV